MGLYIGVIAVLHTSTRPGSTEAQEIVEHVESCTGGWLQQVAVVDCVTRDPKLLTRFIGRLQQL